MESNDGWSLGWGRGRLWSVFQPGAPGDPKPRTAAPARPEPKFVPPALARGSTTSGSRTPRGDRGGRADGGPRAWRLEDGDDASALQLATTLVDWSLAVLSGCGLGARPAK